MEISKNELKKDSRFFIDERNIERLTHQKILDCRVERKRVGMLLRAMTDSNRIVTLDQTRVYAYLAGTEEGEKQYEDYVNLCNVPFRNREAYDALIEEMSNNPYDISKGAIVVNQDNIVYDGQHRSCFLLYKYGPNYKIDIVKLIYEDNSDVISRLINKKRVLVAKARAFLLCLLNIRR